MTSSASIKTQSAAGNPSIRAILPNFSLIRSASFVAMDATRILMFDNQVVQSGKDYSADWAAGRV